MNLVEESFNELSQKVHHPALSSQDEKSLIEPDDDTAMEQGSVPFPQGSVVVRVKAYAMWIVPARNGLRMFGGNRVHLVELCPHMGRILGSTVQQTKEREGRFAERFDAADC